jgi:hypothetical protein
VSAKIAFQTLVSAKDISSYHAFTFECRHEDVQAHMHVMSAIRDAAAKVYASYRDQGKGI